MDDKTLRQNVMDELEFEPSIDAEHIGVAVEGGIVTLTGHVTSYAQKIHAELTAGRVKGVRGIAQEIEVRYASTRPIADDQIAKRAADALELSLVPPGSVQVSVQKGWVKLTGKVDWQYQKASAESAVSGLDGVTGLGNHIEIKPHAEPKDVKRKIVAALHRSAQVEADNIRVFVTGGKVKLEGKVKAWSERRMVERAAWSVPGVADVEDQLTVY